MAVDPPTASELAVFRAMSTADDVASFFDMSEKRLNFHLFSIRRPRYTAFDIPKRGGGRRTISMPPELVRIWQRHLLRYLDALFEPRKEATGFTRDRSIVNNAIPHLGARLVLSFDLEDFFHTIHFGRVRGIFERYPFGFSRTVATLLAQLCCDRGRLPQGAPTSPILSNLACRGLDTDLKHLASRHRCKYTRYADDITISTRRRQFDPSICRDEVVVGGETPQLGAALEAIVITKHSFRINARKTRARRRNQRQEVTGLTVNNRPHANVPRSYVMQIRAALHNWKRHGRAVAQQQLSKFDAKKRRGSTPRIDTFILGKLNFLSMVRGDGDRIFARYAIELRDRLRHEGERPHPVPLHGRAHAGDGLLVRAIWVLQGLNGDGDELHQATAFYLERVGFVTSRHTFDDASPDVARWRLRHGVPGDPDGEIKVNGIRKHSHPPLDVAILETEGVPSACLRRSRSKASLMDVFTVAGYPNWLTVADGLAISKGTVTQQKCINGVDFVLGTAPIRGGNSGGPMLNSAGLVIGVATYNATNSATPNSGIAIRHVDDVLKQPISLL